MKTIRKINATAGTLLLFVLALVTQSTWAQPVVTVPSSCNVVVAGVGGTTGLGGVVGSGGIVLMPDLPTAAGTFTVNPMGNTILGWSLAGDLSVGPIAQPTAAVQSAGAVLSVFITSYNKAVRFSETIPPSTSTLARSKGRVSISYTNPGATCGGGIQFDIFKQYVSTGTGSGFLPPIIGPDCWAPNTTYTYSVDQVASDNYTAGIGGDEYYWSIPGILGTVYTSADKSSITFTTPGTLTGPYLIYCAFGRANPWDGNVTPPAPPSTGSWVSKPIGQQPGSPAFTTAPPTCLLTSASSFNVGITPILGYTYAWTSSNPTWTLGLSGTQMQNLGVTTAGNDPGTLTLTITNGSCTPSIFTYVVNRQFAAPLVITGPSCVASPSVSTFSISGGLQNLTCWTAPAGWGIASANGLASSIINLTVPSLTPAGAYTITARSCACPSGVLSFVVNVRPGIPTIAGNACVIRNGGPTEVYTATATTPGLSYNWTYPTGWSCTGCTSVAPTFQPGGTLNPPQTLTVTSVGTNGCNATSAAFTVNYKPIAPNSYTASCWNFGVAGTTTITVANRPVPFYGSYTVTSVPAGLVTSTAVNGTGIITVTTSATAPAGSYQLVITHTTPFCGNASTTFPAFTYNGNGAFMTTVYNPSTTSPDVYIANGAPGGSTFQWYVNGVAVPPPTGTAQVLSLTGNGTPPTSVCVDVSSGGCITRICASPVGTHSLMPLAPGTDHIDKTSQVEIFPNPTDGNFTMKVPAFEQSASVMIIDAAGRQFGTHELKAGENRISERGLITGEYFLILNIDGEYSSHKLQVSQK